MGISGGRMPVIYLAVSLYLQYDSQADVLPDGEW